MKRSSDPSKNSVGTTPAGQQGRVSQRACRLRRQAPAQPGWGAPGAGGMGDTPTCRQGTRPGLRPALGFVLRIGSFTRMVGVGCLLALVCGGDGWAESQMVSVGPGGATVGVQAQQGVEPLTLEAVWAKVEANHPELVQAALKQRVAEANLLEKQGAFDPRLTSEPFYQNYNSSSKRGSDAEGYGADVGVEMLTRYGAKLSAGGLWNHGSVKSPASATGQAGTYAVGVTVPLLRGARVNDKAVAERAARIKVPLAGAMVQGKRLELLGKASKSYWSWWAARQKVTVGAGLLRLARERAEQTRKRADAGDIAAIDVVEAGQEVARREGALAGYQQELAAAALELALYLWESPEVAGEPPVEAQVPVLTDLPAIPDEGEVARQLEEAFRTLPQFAQLGLEKELVGLEQEVANNLRLPQVDVTLKPGVDVGSNSVGPVLTAGVSVIVPLRNRTAEGRMAAARWSLAQLNSQQKQQVQALVVGVRQSVVAMQAARSQWEAARQELANAQRLEAGERERYRLGDTTLFLVNTREQATGAAQLKVIEAEKTYRGAFYGLGLLTNVGVGPFNAPTQVAPQP